MKKQFTPQSSPKWSIVRKLSAAFAGVCLGLSAVSALAQSAFNWDGGDSSSLLWSTANNWNPDGAPANSFNASYIFSGAVNTGTTGAQLNNDLTTGTITNVTFDATAAAFFVTGNTVTNRGNITNSSGVAQTWNVPMIMAPMTNFLALETNYNHTVNVGSGSVWLGGTITTNLPGNSAFSKTGSGTLYLTNGGLNILATAGNSIVGSGGTNISAAFNLDEGSLVLDGGAASVYTVLGEANIGRSGLLGNKAVSMTINSGIWTNNTWFSVARGNGVGAFSSAVTLNNSAQCWVGNFGAGFNAGDAARLPLGSVNLNNTSTFTVTGNGNFNLAESPGSDITLTLSNSASVIAAGTGFKALGQAGKGTVNITDSGTLSFGNATAYIGWRTGTGVVNMVSGTFRNAGELRVGGSDQNGTGRNARGTFNMSGGNTFVGGNLVIARGNNNQNGCSGEMIVSGGTLTATNDIVIGFAGANALGKLTISGGTVNQAMTAEKWLIVGQWDTMRGELEITSGALNLFNNTDLRFSTGNTVGSNVVNQSGGTVTFYSDLGTNLAASGIIDMQQAGQAATINTYNLNGGTLSVAGISSSATTGTRIFNLNGGTLRATTNNAAFMNLGSGTTRANVRNGGAIINSDGKDITIAQALLHSDISGDADIDGGLTKLGAGTLTLSGGYTYQGNTVVSAGALAINAVLTPPASPAGNVTNNATFSLALNNGTASIPASNVTLAASSVLNLDYGTLTGIPLPAVAATGALTVSGATTINISGFGLATNQISLIDYTGTPLSGGQFANLSLGTLPPGVVATLSNNVANTSLDLVVTSTGQNLAWYGLLPDGLSVSNNWDISLTTNWVTVGTTTPALPYKEYTAGGSTVGDPVRFDDTVYNDFINPQPTNINLTAVVRPFQLVVDSTLPYSITGPGSLVGLGKVIKTNTGSLFLGTSNSYTGGTVISGGSVIITNNSALGTNTGTVTLAGGSLQVNASLASSRLITLTANSSIGVGAGATATWSGRISGANAFTKTDTGTLTTTTSNALTGNVFVKQGALTLDSGGVIANNTWVSIGQVVGDNGTLNLKGTGLFACSFDFNVADVDDAIGTLNIQDSANLSVANLFIASANNASSTANGTVNQTGGTVTQTNTAAGFFCIGGRNAATAGGVGVYNLSGGTVNAFGGVRLGERGTGTVNQTNGTFNARQGINLARFAGSTGTYNLVGGTLATFNIASSTAINATFNFNGGVLQAAFSPGSPFMSGLTAANVLAGGAIIDASSNNITISQALLDGGGGGGLTKRGTGPLTLTGTNTYTGSTLVSTGALFVTTAHQVTGPLTIADNATFGVIADAATNATIGNLTLGSVSNTTLQFTLLSGVNPVTPVLKCGTLTRNGTNTVRLSGILSPGTFPLVKYTGAIGGSGIINSNALVPHGIVAVISNDVATSTIYAIVSGTPGVVWQGYSTIAGRTNLWDLNATTNWLAAGAPSDYAETTPPGDSVTFNDTGSSTVLLSNTVSPASLLITNNSVAYNFTGSGRIAGTTGITKMGTGTATLALTNANTYTGNTVISNGTLQLGSAVSIPDGTGTGNLIVGSVGTLQLNGFGETVNGLIGSGLIDNSAAGAVTLTVGNGGANVPWSGTITNTGAGAVNLLKTGTGTLTISGTNYLGGGNSQINGGTNYLTATGRIEPVGTSEFWVMQNAGTARLEVNGGRLSVNSWLVIARNASNASGTLVVNSGTVEKGGANNIVVGSLNGNGLLEINGGQVLNNGNLWVGENNLANATVRLNGGLLQATQVRPQGTTPALSEVYFNGGIMQASTNSDDFFGTNATAARSVFTVEPGGLYFDTQGFSVTNQADLLNDGSSLGGLVKLGSGLLAINSTGNSYGGMTTVSNGTLNVNGTIYSPVTVKSGATLGGNGTISGDVAVQAGGTVGAGASIGTLTISGNLALAGNVMAEVNTSVSPSNDLVVVSGTLTNTGAGNTLTVSNTGPALVLGDSFQLFSQAMVNGGALNIAVTPPLGSGLGFTNKLAVDGTIAVIAVSTVSTNPPTLTNSVSGSTLTLSWAADHLGWTLQKQTNSRAIGLKTNWFDLTGSESMTTTNIAIDKNDPTVFYRLRYTIP